MPDEFDVSVVISTYNRSGVLPRALDGVLAQEAPGLRYEVLVVDNNSTDRTAEVIESYARRGHANLRYLFEARQGVSYGRNTGIAQAKAPIVAFTDDDLQVAPDWVASIKRGLEQHPEVDYIGGKQLPTPGQEFPKWLSPRHWYPVDLRDPGDQPFYLNSQNPICLGAGNLAMRKAVLLEFDSFSPEYPRGQDRELQLRLWRAGRQGMYLPELVAFNQVPSTRLTKAYHRKWYSVDGHFSALMRDEEVEQASARLFDVPAHLYRQAMIDAWKVLWLRLRGRVDESFFPELQLRYFRAFYRTRRSEFLRTSEHGTLRDLARFARALLTR